MSWQELKEEGFLAAVGVIATACMDYFISHPATAISSVIMLLLAWERYKKMRFKAQEMKRRANAAKIQEEMMKDKLKDWQERLQAHQKEEEETHGRKED